MRGKGVGQYESKDKATANISTQAVSVETSYVLF